MEKMSVEERLKEVQMLYEELLNSSNLGKIENHPKTPESIKMKSVIEIENSSGKIIPIIEEKNEEYTEEKETEIEGDEPLNWRDFTDLDHEMKNNLIKRLMFSVYFYFSKYKSLLRKFKALQGFDTSEDLQVKTEFSSPGSYVKADSTEIQSNF